MAKRKSARKSRKVSTGNESKVRTLAYPGTEVQFAWPSWVAPQVILAGVISKIDVQNGEPLYSVKVKRQSRKRIDVADTTFPTFYAAFETVIVNEQIEKVPALLKHRGKG